jgi:hypothetical protein
MQDYRTVKTTPEVWAVIHASHRGQLRVFGSFSAPEGNYLTGNMSIGEMFTSYGFKHGDYPIMEARTTWTISRENDSRRKDEKTEYWLCLPVKEE